MTYTLTCPDPECKTVFTIEEEDFDLIYDSEDPIECPGCEVEYEWTFDPDATPEITLTDAAEYEEESEDDEFGSSEDDTDDE